MSDAVKVAAHSRKSFEKGNPGRQEEALKGCGLQPHRQVRRMRFTARPKAGPFQSKS
jgi:hypothetical protein